MPDFSAVRIVVAEPRLARPESEVVEGLSGLGIGVVIEVVRDASECRACIASRGADLVILDWRLGREAVHVLADLRRVGLPVVVVLPEDVEDAETLSAFRQGAADCVELGGGFADLLPAVALDLLRRSRQNRERDAAERRIVELQRYTENILQNMNSALLVVDRQGEITAANPTAEAILESDPGGLVGRVAADWFQGGRGEPSLIARTLVDGVRFKGAETVISHPDGRSVPIGISCAPMTSGDGQARHAVAIFQDLTEIKQLELQILQSEKMASIGELAAGVAHEINNPVGFIHANLYQMAEYLGDLRRVWKKTAELQVAVSKEDMSEIRSVSDSLTELFQELDIEFIQGDFAKAVRESQEGSERIRHIVQDLRDFSHKDTGDRERADVNHCVESTASIVWTMMKHSVVLDKDYHDIPLVSCYPMQIKQVLMNLLVNAYQAIEARLAEGTDPAPGHILIRTQRCGEGVSIDVHDNGVGIADGDRSRIFDPFFTTKEVGAGTGLGLSTSYNIIQRHGGTLKAQARDGGGTVFEVWLPHDPLAVDSLGV